MRETLVVYFWSFISIVCAHMCVHDEIMKNLHSGMSHEQRRLHSTIPQEYEPFHDAHGRRLQGTQYSKIRLLVDTSLLDAGADPFACSYANQVIPVTLATNEQETYRCQESDVLDDAKRTFIRNSLVPAAVEFFRATLSVIPVQGNLVLNQPWPQVACHGNGFYYRLLCCADYWPSKYTTGAAGQVDYVLVLTGRPTSGGTLAWAVDCMSDQIARPISGHANLSPARVSAAPKELQYQLAILTHEVMHALGFSQSKMMEFRRPGTVQPISTYSEVLSYRFEQGLQKPVSRLITPKVVAAAKAHYNCYDWPNAGMEIEDGGGSGTAGSHWEKRVAMYDIMNGMSERIMYRSAITLAYFDDSGWYSVDYSRAERLPWGDNEGCTFVTQRCNRWSNKYFCSSSSLTGCTTDMRYVGQCTYTTQATSVDPAFQYFDDPKAAGYSMLPDHCPYFEGFINRDCSDAGTISFSAYGERPGPGAKCFAGTFQRASISSTPSYHGACLTTSCDPVSSLIVVSFPGNPPTTVKCPRSGGTVDLSIVENSQFTGTLECPRSEVLCGSDLCASNDCGGRGQCNPADGTCACYPGFFGSDEYSCDRVECPSSTNEDCSGHGVCNSRTGLCEDGSGFPGCFEGFRGSDCSEQGCPTSFSERCTLEACECGGFGACTNGTCICEVGYVGSGCQFTACLSANGDRCNGMAAGDCNGRTGYCECAESVRGSNVPFYYDGPACEVFVNGSARPYTPLTFVTEGNYGIETFQGILTAKQSYFFSLEIPDTQYRITVSAKANVSSDSIRLLASYADADEPTTSIAQYVGSPTGVQGQMMIDLASSTSLGSNRIMKAGTLVVLAASSVNAAVNISAKRDGCAVLTCVFGRCSDGQCLCDSGWAGRLCDVPDCPGTPDCGGRGTCRWDHCFTSTGEAIRPQAGACTPFCECSSTYFTGLACETVDVEHNVAAPLNFRNFQPRENNNNILVASTSYASSSAIMTRDTERNVVLIQSTTTGSDLSDFQTVAIVDPQTFKTFLTPPFSVYMRLNVTDSPDADGMLLASENVPPELSMIGTESVLFDSAAWRQSNGVHEFLRYFPTTDSSTILFGRVFNGKYATTRLAYTFYMEIISGACSPALANCSGHGVCAISGLSCECEAGYRGIRCEIPVVQLNATSNTEVSVTVPSSWAFCSAPLAVDTVQVRVSFEPAPRTQIPLITVATERQQAARTMGVLLSETAHFDYDSATRGRSPSLLVRRANGDARILIGVHFPRSGQTSVRGTLKLQSYSSSATPSCSSSDVACMEQACHGRGTYSPDSRSCRCTRSWSDATDCASPMFASLQKLVSAAQSLRQLCSVCSVTFRAQAASDVTLLAIPQTSQKSTSAFLEVDSDRASSAAIFISYKLPKSILDFVSIVSNSQPSQNITLASGSSGRFIAAILAHAQANYTIQASRKIEAVTSPTSPSFAAELRHWVVDTTPGRVVLAFGALLIVSFILGCILQTRARKARVKARATIHETISQNLGLFRLRSRLELVERQHGPNVFDDKPALKKVLERHNSSRPTSTSSFRSAHAAPTQVGVEKPVGKQDALMWSDPEEDKLPFTVENPARGSGKQPVAPHPMFQFLQNPQPVSLPSPSQRYVVPLQPSIRPMHHPATVRGHYAPSTAMQPHMAPYYVDPAVAYLPGRDDHLMNASGIPPVTPMYHHPALGPIAYQANTTITTTTTKTTKESNNDNPRENRSADL